MSEFPKNNLAQAWIQTVGETNDAIAFRALYRLQQQAATIVLTLANGSDSTDEMTQLLCMIEAEMLLQTRPTELPHNVLYHSVRWLDWHRQIAAQRAGRRNSLSEKGLEIIAPDSIPSSYFELHGLSPSDSARRLAVLTSTRHALQGMRFTQLPLLDRVISSHR